MDVNLTDQLWGTSANWLPVVVVIIGGIITYYTTTKIERDKRRFDLKQQIYFEAIEIFSDIFRFLELGPEYDDLQQSLAKKYTDHREVTKETVNQLKEYSNKNKDDLAQTEPTDEQIAAQLEESTKDQAKEIEYGYEDYIKPEQEMSESLEKGLLRIENTEQRERWNKSKKKRKVIERLIILKYKLILCKTPNDIQKSVNEVIELAKNDSISDMSKKISNELMPKLSKDLDKFKS